MTIESVVQSSDLGEPELDLITTVAALYYIEQVTQEELSQRLDISRTKVGRLLRRAREIGIVEIRVHAPLALGADLEKEFRRRFGLERLFVTLDNPDEAAQRASVASLVASYLNRVLADEMIVAVGVGRNVSAVADSAYAPTRRNVVFVSAIGGFIRAGEHMSSDHICRKLALRFGGVSETLYAPSFVADPSLRAALLGNATVKQTLDRARRADIALIGIGDGSEKSTLVRMGWFSSEEIVEARLAGAIGDMMCYNFLDISGSATHTNVQDRIIGLTIADLQRIPDVIAVASEANKVAGILAGLRTGAIKTLATSVGIAHTVLNLDDATKSKAR